MNKRRSFLKKALGAGSLFSLGPLAGHVQAEDIADALFSLRHKIQKNPVEEEIWERIAQAYTVSPTLLNLNNGGVSPQPKIVQDAVDRYYHLSNEAPSYYMWRILDQGREALRKKLEALAGVQPDTLAINRNTTEALATVTWGLDLNRGDEIIMTRQDYPNMIHAWKQREMRDGIKIKWINFQLPMENDQDFIQAFIDSTTNKTKIWHLTHMINWTGQILPVKKLCAEARKRGILSIVDGAHTFAHMNFKLSDFDSDFYGTSLHKWLSAPFGTGFLYVRPEHINKLWPLFPNDKPQSADIRKFESLGTRSFATEQGIGQAIDFHQAIGSQRKSDRLHELKKYWCDGLKNHPRIKFNTSLQPDYSCALANFSIEGMDPETVASKLLSEYRIHTVAIKWENISGIRVTPHVYTLKRDLDRFIEATLKIASQ